MRRIDGPASQESPLSPNAFLLKDSRGVTRAIGMFGDDDSAMWVEWLDPPKRLTSWAEVGLMVASAKGVDSVHPIRRNQGGTA